MARMTLFTGNSLSYQSGGAMFTRIMSIIVACCLSNVVAATVSLNGTIVSGAGTPVAGARVSLKNYPSIVGVSTAVGAFTLAGNDSKNLPKDSLVVVARGYRTSLLALTTYQKSGIVDTLVASKTWKPAGNLQRQGGMVKIMAKGYDFEMGQPSDTVRGLFFDMPTSDVEQPVHTVSFTHDFWMDTTEVCQGLYDSIMKMAYGSKYVRPDWNGSNGLGRNWAAYSIEWGSAALYCNARSKCQGLPDTAYSYTKVIGSVGALCTLQNVVTNLHANAYRLPTEAEWEYACRAGSTTDYYWGKDVKPYPATLADTVEMGGFAVWDNNSFGLGKDKIIKTGPGLDSSYYGSHEAGKKKPNAYGLYDMAGNLSEWCNDWYDYYTWGAATDPVGVSPANPSQLPRVRRGGNWSSGSSYLRSTERQFEASDYQFLFCGFRTVSSGNIATGIKRSAIRKHESVPFVTVSRGSINFVNAAGQTVGIYSLNGSKIASVAIGAMSYSYATRAIPAGTYLVRFGTQGSLSRMVTVLP